MRQDIFQDIATAPAQHSRRNLLKVGSASLAALMLADVHQAFAQVGLPGLSGGINGGTFGVGDVAILNYAYALEQLEAAFYTAVLERPYNGMSRGEQDLLVGIRDHEIAHREFLKQALGGNALPDLEVDFSRVDGASRQSVLTAARSFEDLGVSAYNGAGQLLSNPQYLAAAGSIVSVEARHAATIRDLISPRSSSFAGSDIVDGQGLDEARLPSQVLPKVKPYVLTPINPGQLP
ncbi:MAG: ferritin-like domain-containing protein [Janthinobacterium lividum]